MIADAGLINVYDTIDIRAFPDMMQWVRRRIDDLDDYSLRNELLDLMTGPGERWGLSVRLTPETATWRQIVVDVGDHRVGAINVDELGLIAIGDSLMYIGDVR